MKKLFFVCCALALFCLTCDELPPQISPVVDQGECQTVAESTVANQQRQVLIEEFTGVRCVNCPAGSEAIEDLLAIHGEQLVAISIHAGFFSNPYQESLYDFQTNDGDNILSFVGEPLGFPTAVVNRKLFDGETSLQIGRNSWANYIAQELTEAPKAKLAIVSNWDDPSRTLDIEVSAFAVEAITDEDVRVSVVITENNVVDYQLTPNGKESDYVHKHVFRDAVTNFDGNPVTVELVAGATFCKSYSIQLDDAWNEDNCHIIAFIHLGGASKEVLQVVETSVK